MSGQLAGRHIVITGAANGIGRATVERMLAEGALVGGIDRDGVGLAALVAAHGAGRFCAAEADVSDPDQVDAAVAACARGLGAIDGLVCAAGIDLVSPLEQMTTAQWRRIMDVNLTGPMLAAQACLAHLRAAGGGTIVTVSSGAGLSPLKHRTAYCASKAGLQMFTKALAMEAAAFGVRVNTVCPGAVETGLLRSGLDGLDDPVAARAEVTARYALARIAEPTEIANAILWLTSAESSYVTGTAIAVDGGRTFH